MVLVYLVYNKASNKNKKVFLDTAEIGELTDENINRALLNKGININNEVISLDLLATIKEQFFPSKFNDFDVLELIKVYTKATKNTLDYNRFNALLAKNRNKKIKEAGIELSKSATAMKRSSLMSLPGYAKEVFDKIDTMADAKSSLRILKTLEEIIVLKTNTEKKIKSLTRYPKVVYYFIAGALCVILYVAIPNIKELVKSFVSDFEKLNPISLKVYALSDAIVASPVSFIIMWFIGVFLVYKTLYATIRFIVKRIPYIARIEFYKDHALFFGMLGTFLTAGVSSMTAYSNASEVISSSKNRAKIKEIIKDMIVKSKDLATALEDHKYDTEVVEFVQSRRGLSDMETYEELKDMYFELMTERVEASSTLVQPVSMVFLMIMLLGMVIAAFAPIGEVFSSISTGGGN